MSRTRSERAAVGFKAEQNMKMIGRIVYGDELVSLSSDNPRNDF